MDEFAVLKECLPLTENLDKYLCIKTKVKYHDDVEFRVKTNLDTMVRRFGHSGWTEMKPLIVGIKCSTSDSNESFFYIRHSDRMNENTTTLEMTDIKSDVWHTFKYPLLENYHTETRINLGNTVTSYTLAILNVAQYLRHKHSTNYFPSGYVSFDTQPYGEYNKPLVYTNGSDYINPSNADLASAIIVGSI